MPAPAAFPHIRLLGRGKGAEAGLFGGVGEVGRGETVADEFGECAAVPLAAHLFGLVLG